VMPVYFIQDEGGEIKIGYSQCNPHKRLKAFRTGNPRELKLLVSIPGGGAEERELHERFADLRTRGEWFRPDGRLLGFIEAMQYTYRHQQPEPEGEADDEFVALNSLGIDGDTAEAIKGISMASVCRLQFYESLRRAERLVRDGSNEIHDLDFIHTTMNDLMGWLLSNDSEPFVVGAEYVFTSGEVKHGHERLDNLLSLHQELVNDRKAAH